MTFKLHLRLKFSSFGRLKSRNMSGSKCVLVTGGAGYIGTHTVVELVNAGYDVVIADNFVNAFSGQCHPLPCISHVQQNFICIGKVTLIQPCYFIESIKRVEEITGKKIAHYSVDLLNKEALKQVFSKVYMLSFESYCASPENIPPPQSPNRCVCVCFGGGGQKQEYGAKLEFLECWGVQSKKKPVEGSWIFSITTNLLTVNLYTCHWCHLTKIYIVAIWRGESLVTSWNILPI